MALGLMSLRVAGIVDRIPVLEKETSVFSFLSWLCQSVSSCVTVGSLCNLLGPVFSSVIPGGLDMVVSRDSFFLVQVSDLF